MSTLSFSIGFLSCLPPLQRFCWVCKGWLIHTWRPSCFHARLWPCSAISASLLIIKFTVLFTSLPIDRGLTPAAKSQMRAPANRRRVCWNKPLKLSACCPYTPQCWSCKFTVQDERDALLKDAFKFSFKSWMRHEVQSIKSNWAPTYFNGFAFFPHKEATC